MCGAGDMPFRKVSRAGLNGKPCGGRHPPLRALLGNGQTDIAVAHQNADDGKVLAIIKTGNFNCTEEVKKLPDNSFLLRIAMGDCSLYYVVVANDQAKLT